MSVIDFTLAKKLKDFFTENFGVEPKIRSNQCGHMLAVAMIGSGVWISIWTDGFGNFCLMGNYQIKVGELTNLTDEMRKIGITELNVGHCSDELFALLMTTGKEVVINQATIDHIRRETEELLR